MTQQVRTTYRNHRRGTWVVMLAVLAAVAVLTPTGSAKPPSSDIKHWSICLQYGTSPACASDGAHTTLPGGASPKVKLTVTNLRDSNQSLGSVNLDGPLDASSQPVLPMKNWKYVDGTGTGRQTFGTNTAGELQLRDLYLGPGQSVQVEFEIDTPCTGSGLKWTPDAKQSNNHQGSGNDFQTPSPAAGMTSDIQGCTYIGFVTQPKKTVAGGIITDADYSSGNAIQVGLYSSLTNELLSTCPASIGSVTVSAPPWNLGGTVSSPLSGSPCVASFADLSISGLSSLPQTLTLSASGAGSQATSSPFDIINGTTCVSGQPCETSLKTGNTSSLASQTSGNFVFIGMESLKLDYVPDGCANFESVGAEPLLISEQRTSLSGELFVTYGIDKKLIDKKYGKNNGQQYIPICAGAKRIELVSGKTRAVRCDELYNGHSQEGTGWWGKQLGSDGKFTGALSQALCDPESGYFFGIMGSFQDYTNSNPALIIDPATSPTVTEWWSDTTYRYFKSRWPSASGTGVFATVPWDGYKFG